MPKRTSRPSSSTGRRTSAASQRILGLACLGRGGRHARPARVAAAAPRCSSGSAARPLLGGAAAGAGISLVLVVTGLPLAAWMRARAHRRRAGNPVVARLGARRGQVGRDRRGHGRHRRAHGDGAGQALPAQLVGARRRDGRGLRRDHHLALSGGDRSRVQRVRELPPGPLRSDVLELAEEADVDVGEVYRVDASRRTSAANAYVNGLGHSKRVVLYDNLISGFPRDEVRLVVAHELGPSEAQRPAARARLARARGAGRHVPGPASRRALRAPRRARRPWPQARPVVLPAIALAVALVLARRSARPRTCSRARWRRAPTPSPSTSRAIPRRSSVRAPHRAPQHRRPGSARLLQALFGTHPTTLEIGSASLGGARGQ